jgi:hypothetical protein
VIRHLVTHRATTEAYLVEPAVAFTANTGQVIALAPEPPSYVAFQRLASEDPEALLAWIEEGTLSPADLTFAAEIAGRTLEAERVVPTLVRLLAHEDAVVREGAVIGLGCHLDTPGVRARLERITTEDPSPGVRDTASDLIS